ncbi:MAG: hypothetical protein SR1Q7_10115 [Quinella sp. 1Q7]|nr:hypothetical protein [Quinella sp. 1Q7]
MANEILKNEQLSFDELDQVAGGTHEQTYDDMQFLSDTYPNLTWPRNWDAAVGKLGAIFWEAGMKLDTSENHGNIYYDRVNGKAIDQYRARQYLIDAIDRDPYRFAKFL